MPSTTTVTSDTTSIAPVETIDPDGGVFGGGLIGGGGVPLDSDDDYFFWPPGETSRANTDPPDTDARSAGLGATATSAGVTLAAVGGVAWMMFEFFE